MSIIRYTLIFANLLFAYLGTAQSKLDSTVLLPQVNIQAARSDQYSIGYALRSIDSSLQKAMSGQDLTRLLALESVLTLRTYSPGGLSTVSFGGLASRHTAVLWRGFSLQNPMSNLFDLSLIPLLSGDRIGLQTGGVSALHGGGAIGGAIVVQADESAAASGVQADLTAMQGSFGQQSQTMAIAGAKKNWKGNLRTFTRRADNDFSFVNTTKIGQPLEHQVNAHLRQASIFSENTFFFKNNQRLDLFAWWQNSTRQIPPSTISANGQGQQKDRGLRLGGTWTKIWNRAVWKTRSAWLDDYLEYKSLIVDSSGSSARNWVAESEVTFAVSEQYRLNIGTHAEHNGIQTTNYERPTLGRWRNALFVSGRADWSAQWSASINLRQEWVDRDRSPFTASAGAEWRPLRGSAVRIGASQHFAMPTLNDLYWQPGGNPDLLPEKGWNARIETESVWLQKGKFTLRNTNTLRTADLHDWIEWSPDVTTGLWQPRNIKSVRAQGIDLAWSARWQWAPQRLLMARYQSTFNSSKVIAVHNPELAAATIGKQLIYMPFHTESTLVTLMWDLWNLGAIWQFTGKRYNSPDNNADGTQAHFSVLDAWVERTFSPRKHIQVSVQGSIQNIFGKNYEIIKYQPMPGRGGMLKVRFRKT